MKKALVSAAIALALSGCAAVRQGGDEHAAHHPAGSSPAPAACSPQQMKSMSDMHQKMMSAKTAEERQALMAEHMKSMPGGMPMKCGMGEGGMNMGMRSSDGSMDMMQRCMEMCQMDMSMMKSGGMPKETGK